MTTSDSPQDPSFAVVTPTYLPDLSRCELLAESLDRCAPQVPHYLIVDRRDLPAFRHLQRGRRSLIESEQLVGKWMWRLPGRKGLWLSMRALPVRGWILQQILKIASPDLIRERTLVFCDSDTAFLRGFSRVDLLVDGKVGLLDVEWPSDSPRRWTAAARRLLGLPQRDGGYHNHVGNMICWNRENVSGMRERIETCNGMHWQVALARTTSFSEYMLYGTYVREILEYRGSDHAPSAVPLVKASWGTPLIGEDVLRRFFAELDPQTVAIMVHSKDGVDPSQYRTFLERAWRRA